MKNLIIPESRQAVETSIVKNKIFPRSLRAAAAAWLWMLSLVLPANAGITVTGFGPASWGAPDTTLGIAGYVIEDFEDTNLAPHLTIGWETQAANRAPSTTLPALFDPANDPFGTAFLTPASGRWDGSCGLINTHDNQSHDYWDVAHWGDVVLHFDPGMKSVGFSLMQVDQEVRLIINNTDLGGLTALAGLAINGSRIGYVRLDATGTDTISSIRLANGRSGFNDGFVLDHLAYSTTGLPPENPSVAIALHAGITVTGVVGMRYRIESSETLENPVWQTLTNVVLTTSPQLFFDNTPATPPQRFYRAVLAP